MLSAVLLKIAIKEKLPQRFTIIGLRQDEQRQLIIHNLHIVDFGVGGVRMLYGEAPLHFQYVSS